MLLWEGVQAPCVFACIVCLRGVAHRPLSRTRYAKEISIPAPAFVFL